MVRSITPGSAKMVLGEPRSRGPTDKLELESKFETDKFKCGPKKYVIRMRPNVLTILSLSNLIASLSRAAFVPVASNITIDVSAPLETIRRELFGLDLEFTRHDIWDGLSAELISNRLFAVQPPGSGPWPFPWPANFPPRWTALAGGAMAAPSVTGLSSGVACELSASQPLCGLVQLPVGDGFDAGMSFGSAIGLEAGRGYTFSAVVRASGTLGGAGLTLSVALAPALFAANLSVPDSSEWTAVTYSFVAALTTARADNLTLSVSASQGTLWFNATSLLPNDNFFGMRANVVDALADIKFSGPLRYPGGCYAPFYSWKNGLLPLLSRPTSFTPSSYCAAVAGGVNAYSDGFMQNGPGIDEYIALTNRVGAIPAITFALQYGTPAEIDDARDLVEYCNGNSSTPWGGVRSQRGHPEPYNVRMWYLGNEISSQTRWPNYPSDSTNVTGPISVSEYTAALESLIPAVRAVDASIVLIVVDGGPRFDGAWVAQNFTSLINATSSHVGYANSDQDGSPSSASHATAQAKIPTSTVLADISSVRAFLESGDGSASHVQISVDEWGLGPPWVVKDFGVTHALFGASFLSMIVNCAIEQGVFYTNYFEPINEGAIQVLQFSATPTPLGLVMPLFGTLAGSQRLAVAQTPGVDDDVIAVAATTDNAVYVVLTNRNSTSPYTQWIHFEGVSVAPSATVTMLTSSGFGPNSFFEASTIAAAVSADGWMAVELPAFSLAAVSAATGSMTVSNP